MSDLISRSALLQKFNDTGIQITFDLPVEEILGEDVDIDDFTMLMQDAIQAYKNMIIGTIKDMPTAYNVDVVVAELEDKLLSSSDAHAEAITGMCGASANVYYGEKSAYTSAIDTVRRGGIDG